MLSIPEYCGPNATPPPEYPSCRHRTSASTLSQPSAQIVPFIPCFSTITVAGKEVNGRILTSMGKKWKSYFTIKVNHSPDNHI